MNKVIECLKTRRSVRGFKSDEMPARELIEQVLEAGTYAPTGMGRQSPIIVAITNKEMRDRLSRLNAAVLGTDSDPFYGAPVVLIVLADRSKPTYLYDGSLVMGNLLNAAHAVGLESCWILLAKYGLKMLILTCGVNGSYVFTPGDISFVDTPKVEVADTVGAGDSFTASFVAAILKGKSVADAHRLAVKVSAFVCTQNGAMPELPKEFIQ